MRLAATLLALLPMALLLAGTAGAGDNDAAGTGTAEIYRRLRTIDERMQHEADHPASMGEADEVGGRPHAGAEADVEDLGSDDEDGDSHEITAPAPTPPAAPGIGGGVAPGAEPAADAKPDGKSDAPPKPGAAPVRPLNNAVAPKLDNPLGNPLGTNPLQDPLQSPPPAEDDS